MRAMYQNWIKENAKLLNEEDIARADRLCKTYRFWYIVATLAFYASIATSIICFITAYYVRKSADIRGIGFKTLIYTMTVSSLIAMILVLIQSQLQCQSLNIVRKIYLDKMERTLESAQPDDDKKTA